MASLEIFASRIVAEPAFVINVFPPSSCGSSISESMLAFTHTQESLSGRCGRCYGLNTVRTMADLSSFSIDNNWFQRPWSQSRLGPSVGYPHEPLGHPQYPSVTQSLLVILESFRNYFHVTMNSIIIYTRISTLKSSEKTVISNSPLHVLNFFIYQCNYQIIFYKFCKHTSMNLKVVANHFSGKIMTIFWPKSTERVI